MKKDPSISPLTGKTNQGNYFSLYGNKSPTPTVVLIHGVGLKKQVWQSQIDELTHNFSVLVYDILGHGNSPNPPKTPSLAQFTFQLLDIIRFLNIPKISIVGHSMGALIGLDFALTYPKNVHSLVVMNSVFERSQKQREAVIHRANQVLKTRKMTGIDDTLGRWFENKNNKKQIDKIVQIKQWMSQTNPVGYGRTYQLFACSDQAFSGKLDQLDMPVLYLTGEKDLNSSPEMSLKMAQQTPQGKCIIIEQEAHMMAYISPEKVNPVMLKFLDNL